MEKQKKKDSGITLVALVVSIIVMLVLAGVSLNATIGENGIVTRAQEATLQQKIAEDLENLNLELAKINVDTISTDETMAIQDIASYLVSQGAIDSFITTSAGQIAAGIDTATGNKYFFGVKGDNTYRITRGIDGLLSAEITTQTSGGDITGGYALVTADSFNNDDSLTAEEKGKFTITDDAEVVFMDTISGALSIYVKSGVHATVGIYADMTLTNQGVKRSAIDIEPGGILDLYIGDDISVTVNSGYGEDASGSTGGNGGYAGIHVPWIDNNTNNILDDSSDSYAILNLYGSGTLTAIGGNAGAGEIATNSVLKAGGGGAGAGIGGNGGVGGAPRAGSDGNSKVCQPGGTAENCGIINIHNNVTVHAYGGSGASGGTSARDIGGGAGGYPGAGIGGGGAGGAGATCCAGAGGYSGGSAEGNPNRAINGGAGYMALCGENMNWQGGGYYVGQEGLTTNNNEINLTEDVLGGFGGCAWYPGHSGGDGGTAGIGGIISVSKDANIYSFNGNRFTNGTSYESGKNQAIIYLQNGVSLARYEHFGNDTYTTVDPTHSNGYKLREIKSLSTTETKSGYKNDFYKNLTSTEKIITINKYLTNVDMSYQGVGSGAGYIEVSNGSYTRYNEDSNGNFTTVYTGV